MRYPVSNECLAQLSLTLYTNSVSYLRSNQHLYSPGLEQPLHNSLVLFVEGFVIVADTMFQRFDETLVGDMIEVRLQILQFYVQEAVAVGIRATMCDYVVSSQTTLSAGGYENDDRFSGRVFHNSKVRWFRHCDH